eukprot:s1404_g4.t1
MLLGGWPSWSSRISEVRTSELQAENEELREALQKLKLDSEGSVAKEIEKDAAPVTYRVTAFDGSETDIVLGSGASILDACAAAADWKGLPRMSVRLVVQGQVEPLPQSRTTKLCDAAGGITDLLLVITRFYVGEPSGPLVDQCTASEFLHYPVSAYLADPSSSSKEDIEMQLCDGHRLRVEVGEMGFRGVMFCGTPDGGYTGFSPAMAGRVLVRAILHHHEHALGIGAGTSDSDLRRDPEYDKHFVGLYHGGVTRNVAAFGKRTHRSSNGWHGDNRLAVLFDMDKGTMQCYEELEPFGEEVQIGSDREFWPSVVLYKPGDSASVAVSYL